MPNRTFTHAYASVRFMGDSLDPFDVTSLLRLPYDHINRNGEPRIRRRRDGSVHEYAPYRAGMWSMCSKGWVKSPVLDLHLCWLLDQLEPRSDEIRELLNANNDADFFCYSEGYSADPPTLSRQTRDRASVLGISIDIDHYPLDPDET